MVRKTNHLFFAQSRVVSYVECHAAFPGAEGGKWK